MKIAGADYAFDGSRVTIFFTAPERIDFRDLVHDLAQTLGTRVELRQIGARDETRVRGGVGTCGRTLCCTSWLDKFSNISIRMAKEQDLPLNLSKLTGVCGRLKCCLIYELETYQEVKGKLPKVGEVFHLPSCTAGACGTGGCAKVAGTNVPKEAVVVEVAEGGRMQLTAVELGVTFDPVPAHTKGVVSLAGRDEEPGQEPSRGDNDRCVSVSAASRCSSDGISALTFGREIRDLGEGVALRLIRQRLEDREREATEMSGPLAGAVDAARAAHVLQEIARLLG